MMGMIFGLIGIDASSNLKKTNSQIYKYWRIFFTLYIPISELINYTYSNFCYFNENCSLIYFLFISFTYFCFNLYLSKISWSFYIRLEKNHELLIIHGKYLEHMIREENTKINETNLKKYISADKIYSQNINNSKKNNYNLIAYNEVSGELSEDQNKTRVKNPFLNALKNLK